MTDGVVRSLSPVLLQVNRKLRSLLAERREVDHVELDEFLVEADCPCLATSVTNSVAVYHRGPQRGGLDCEDHPGERPDL